MSFEFSFPDFTKCVQFNELHILMGISEIHLSPIPEETFTRTITKTIKRSLSDSEKADFLDKFSKGIDFRPNEIKANNNGLLELNGQGCCIYIKEQHQNYRYNSSYKYHIFECRTIQSMISDGRKARYVATSRHDGLFNVVKQIGNRFYEKEEKLDICKNCLEILKQRGWWSQNFNLKDFFQVHKNLFSNTYLKEETIVAKERYAPNHDEIAREYKKQVNWICQICKVDCSNNNSLLHLHHKNGNGNDNTHINLMVLCVKCHSEQPNHAHMKTKFANDILQCKHLQNTQGIF